MKRWKGYLGFGLVVLAICGFVATIFIVIISNILNG